MVLAWSTYVWFCSWDGATVINIYVFASVMVADLSKYIWFCFCHGLSLITVVFFSCHDFILISLHVFTSAVIPVWSKYMVLLLGWYKFDQHTCFCFYNNTSLINTYAFAVVFPVWSKHTCFCSCHGSSLLIHVFCCCNSSLIKTCMFLLLSWLQFDQYTWLLLPSWLQLDQDVWILLLSSL